MIGLRKKTVKRKARPRQVIGYSDRVDFPDFGLVDIAVKIDTGAYTSALHCTDVRLVQDRDRTRLRFTLASGQPGRRKQFMTDSYQYKTIKNSFGQAEKRFVIHTRVVILGRIIRAEFSLANRGTMRFPVLLGRKLLRNKFIVDVAQKDVSYNLKQITVPSS